MADIFSQQNPEAKSIGELNRARLVAEEIE
jgi:hypothetical protein